MFRIKVCGVTRPADAIAAVEAGVDAIGLNFYAPSPRSVTLAQAKQIAETVEGRVLLVGVFVNASSEVIARAWEEADLGAIQLHGDETAASLLELPATAPLIRAFRVGADGLRQAAEFAAACRGQDRPLGAVLLDAAAPPEPGVPPVYGGSGHRLDWDGVRRERASLSGQTMILAGGLTPSNVAEAITRSGADGVDTASGVESSPGVKDVDLIRGFVAGAKKAFQTG